MDSFEAIGYKIRKEDIDETVYFRHLGDTEFTIVLDKRNCWITKYANDFRKIVEVHPDENEISALKLYFKQK